MSTRRISPSRLARPAIGLAISAVFVAATLSRVELGLLEEAWAGVGIGLVALAVAVSFAEVAVRALRWHILLRPLVATHFRLALAYLSIGHLANALLPARLGDVARAFLTGGRLRASRATILGTIAVERVADASLLGITAAAGILVGYATLGPAVAFLGLGGLALVVVGGLVALALGRTGVGTTHVGTLARRYAGLFAAGASSLRLPSVAASVGILTVAAFALTIGIMQLVTSAVGISLSILQAALVVAAVTLSTAIPAGPASLGTYEFVGVTVLGTMGFGAEVSLVAIALVHLVVTLVPAAIGLVAMWALGVRRLVPHPGGRVPEAAAGRVP